MRRFLAAVIVVAIATGLSFYAVQLEPKWLAIRHYGTSPELIEKSSAAKKPLRIAMIGDMHLHSYGVYERRVSDELKSLQPDLIILVGGIIGASDAMAVTSRFLDSLMAFPVVAVLGGSERRMDRTLEWWGRYFRQHGTRLLVNEQETFDLKGWKIVVTGLDDFVIGEPDLSALTKGPTGLDSETVDLWLALEHAPGLFGNQGDAVESAEAHGMLSRKNLHAVASDTRPHLCLSGHTHGGQVVLLGYAAEVPPGSGPFLSGLYRTPNCLLYVTTGIGTFDDFTARFGVRPEIAVFDF